MLACKQNYKEQLGRSLNGKTTHFKLEPLLLMQLSNRAVPQRQLCAAQENKGILLLNGHSCFIMGAIIKWSSHTEIQR